MEEKIMDRREKPLTEKQKFALELILKQREMQMQFMYFWMALNASAIAFAISTSVNKTSEALMLASIACWGVSFLCGGICLLAFLTINHMDITLLTGKNKDKEELKDMRSMISGPKRANRLMFLFMISGMILFITWYVKTLK
ncbi:MAG: hypothetical protein ACO1O6_11410 [Bacteroidota bacterium]